jgi:hypothetical protein
MGPRRGFGRWKLIDGVYGVWGLGSRCDEVIGHVQCVLLNLKIQNRKSKSMSAMT